MSKPEIIKSLIEAKLSLSRIAASLPYGNDTIHSRSTIDKELIRINKQIEMVIESKEAPTPPVEAKLGGLDE